MILSRKKDKLIRVALLELVNTVLYPLQWDSFTEKDKSLYCAYTYMYMYIVWLLGIKG